MEKFKIICKDCGSERCVFIPHYEDKWELDSDGEDYWFDELVGFEIQCLDCENVGSDI